MSLRITTDERCLFCTTSARSYQVGDGVESTSEGDLQILWSTCLECGFTVPTSNHDLRQVVGDLEVVQERLDSGDVALILPLEAVVYFHPASPEQLVNGCRELGFTEIEFELLGDELVAGAYQELWDDLDEETTWIRSTSPILVEYVRHRHPELLKHLAPIVTPAVALGRYLRSQDGTNNIVYTGLDLPGYHHHGLEEMMHLTLEGLERLLEDRDIEPQEMPESYEGEGPRRRRHLSVPGGMPHRLLESESLNSRQFRKIRNLRKLASISEMLEHRQGGLGFLDVLPFDGALDHPALGPHDELLIRRRIAEEAEGERSDEPVVDPDVDVDVSIAHQEIVADIPAVELNDVVGTFNKLGIPAHEVLTQGGDKLAMCPFYMGRRYEKAVQDARHDAVTNLYTYGAFEERFEEEVARANREGTGIALLLVDIDDFKSLNEKFGHAAGNRVLRSVGQMLENSVRQTDIIARYGGDEIVLILINPTPGGATMVAEKVRTRVEGLEIKASGEEIPTTVSVGIGFHSGQTRGALSSDDLFAEAEASLHIAKGRGGNQIHPHMTEELTQNEL